jgi:hypothetical protein
MLFIRLVIWLLILSVPILGVWIASSLAAFANGPVELVVVAGALLFPIGPIGWELAAGWLKARRRKRAASGSFFQDLDRRRRNALGLKWHDRLLLRTLTLNLAFLLPTLVLLPQTTWLALTTRGDWMLDTVEAPWADNARRSLHAMADLTENWFAEEQDEYEAMEDDRVQVVLPPPRPVADAPTTAHVHLSMPSDALVRFGQDLPPIVRAKTGEVVLPRGETFLVATFDDGRRIRCAFEATDTQLRLAGAGSDYVLETPTGPAPCDALRDPVSEWDQTLSLAYRASADEEWWVTEKDVLTPEHVTGIQVRPPFTRLTLTDEGSKALCTATTKREHRRFYLLARNSEGTTTSTTRLRERLCDPVFSLQTDSQEVALGDGTQVAATSSWPWQPDVHPAVADIPKAMEASIELVGEYLVEAEPDDALRLRALHDYVVTRIAYDGASLDDEKRKPQDADTVFRTKKGVCAGYANLMVVLGHAAKLDVAYVTGTVRDKDGGLAGSSHAWNAARVDGKWLLIDATWDAGFLNDNGDYEANYRTDYFGPPPDIFRLDHLPSDSEWQLATPMSKSDFVRQPIVKPGFLAAGLQLADPRRAQVTVDDQLTLRFVNPAHQSFIVDIADSRDKCTTTTSHGITKVSCHFPRPGSYKVHWFHNESSHGSHRFGGRMSVNARG